MGRSSDGRTAPSRKLKMALSTAKLMKKKRRSAPSVGPTGRGISKQAIRSNSRDPERTSANILAAAIKEFAEKGFGGARIDHIAERSGSNKRMIYHYFGDKEALYIAVLEAAYFNIRAAERSLELTKLDPIAAIEKLVLFTWDYYLQHPEFLPLLGIENLHKARYLKRSARIFNLHTPLISLISEVIDRGVESKQFRSDIDPIKLYITIASLGAFYFSNRWTLSTIFRRDLTADQELANWGKHISAVVLAYVRA
jgi:AcrR family transcriptional regulator